LKPRPKKPAPEVERRTDTSAPPNPLKASKGRRAGDPKQPLRPEDRARRYLTEGRVTLTHVEPGRILATCSGLEGAEYRLGLEPGHGWWCSCEEMGLCAHLMAVQLVTELKPGGFVAGK